MPHLISILIPGLQKYKLPSEGLQLTYITTIRAYCTIHYAKTMCKCACAMCTKCACAMCTLCKGYVYYIMCLLQDTSPEVLNLVAIQNKLKDYGMAELVIKQVYRNQTCTCLTYILALPETC